MRCFVGLWVLLCGSACAPPSSTATTTTKPTAGTQPAGWDDDMRIAEAADLDPDPHRAHFQLTAALVDVELTPGVFTQMWSYNGQVPGPTLRAAVGDHVVIDVHNDLPEATTVHWHGVRVPAAMDGTDMMQAPIEPGGDFTYAFDVIDAGTFWYHPHINSSAQVGYGLYGAFVVDEPGATALADELVLVLSDASLDEQGALRPGDDQGWFGDYFGRDGGTALVNGRVLPTLRGSAGVPQLWRIINASRSRYERVVVPGHTFVHVGSDGGLVAEAQRVHDVTLPPGARAELWVVPKAPGETLTVQNAGVDRFHLDTPPEANDLFTWSISDAPVAQTPPAPSHLRDIDAVDITDAVAHDMTLMDVPDEQGTGYFGIDGQLYPDADMLQASTDSVEVWTLHNTTSMDHPFHLHGFFFQVLDVDGVAPATRAWWDTVNLEPDTTTRIAVVFDDRAGNWMLHCHILDHADTGMMRMLMVMP